MIMSTDFNSKVIRLGTVTVSAAILANFVPAVWIWLRYGVVPSFGDIMTLWGMVTAAFGLSWLVQNLSYYGALGAAGTYVSWVSGTAADIRLPGMTMAQKVTGTEANTPEGDAIGAMAVSATVFVSVALISVFTVIGSSIMPYMPDSVKTAFKYIQPALYASVYASMCARDVFAAVLTLVCAVLVVLYLHLTGFPKALNIVVAVVLGMVSAYISFKMKQKKA